jgi:hypothetical protein
MSLVPFLETDNELKGYVAAVFGGKAADTIRRQPPCLSFPYPLFTGLHCQDQVCLEQRDHVKRCFKVLVFDVCIGGLLVRQHFGGVERLTPLDGDRIYRTEGVL